MMLTLPVENPFRPLMADKCAVGGCVCDAKTMCRACKEPNHDAETLTLNPAQTEVNANTKSKAIMRTKGAEPLDGRDFSVHYSTTRGPVPCALVLARAALLPSRPCERRRTVLGGVQ